MNVHSLINASIPNLGIEAIFMIGGEIMNNYTFSKHEQLELLEKSFSLRQPAKRVNLNGNKKSNKEKFNIVKKLEKDIKESKVLDNDVNSVIGQILAFCAYPESFLKGRKESVRELVEVVSSIIYNLGAIENNRFVQDIAVKETVKKLKSIEKEIRISYRRDKYFTDEYWDDIEFKKPLNSLEDIKKIVRDKYYIELENIENSII
ncbi:hypothetical protein [Geobacillus vulcani]|uniref:hypothetical protein n=1 Tax=Geobacillus vulcani TaxID=135517 RepID=UPI00138E4CFF|nr:hypothetical protein [Geobacillus vulcani]